MANQADSSESSGKRDVSRDGQAAHPFVRDFEPYFYGRPITYVDVGAHVGGVFAELLNSSIRVGEAHLVEPNPRAFATMQQAVRDITDVRHIACHNVAISSARGTVTMRDDDSMTRIVETHDTGADGLAVENFEVNTITLDELARAGELDHVNLLKVDVEGHELHVLEGAKDLLSKQAVDVIYIEAGMDPGSQQQSYYRDIEDALREYGYRLSRVYEQRNEWPTDGLALRRANLAFISSAFAEKNPFRVSRELFRVRRRYEALSEEVRELRDTADERQQALDRQRELLERAEHDRDAAAAKLAELEQKVVVQQAEVRQHEGLIDALTRERDAYSDYAEQLEAKYLEVLRSRSWKMTGPLRVATRAARRALGRPTGGRARLPKRPRPNARRDGGYAVSTTAGQCGDIIRMVKDSDFPGLYAMKRKLEAQLATPEGYLGHAFLMVVLARKISAFAFGAEAADGALRRFDGRTHELLGALGERAFRRFVADAAVDYTRVGRYQDARSLLDDAIRAGHLDLLPVRAEVSWIHDPRSAASDLRQFADRPASNGDARKNALLLRHLTVNILDQPEADPTGEWTGGEFSLVDAIRAQREGRLADYRRLVNAYFEEQGLASPLPRSADPFSFDDLYAPAGLSTVADGPLVSVIMTTFNSAGTVRYAVRSVLEQTYRNLELLIVDDASTDDTREVLAELAASDDRITVIPAERNSGTYVGRNLAMRTARGRYLTFHDSDDWAHPERIQKHVQAMEADSALMATRSNWLRVDGDGHIDFRRWHRRLAHPNPASMFLRRDALDAIGYFDTVPFSADSEYWFRAQRVFGRKAIRALPECLGFGRQHDASLTRRGPGARDAEDYSPVRSAYQYSWLEWHAGTGAEDLHLESEPSGRAFWAPPQMLSGGSSDNGETASLAMCYPGLEGDRDVPVLVFGISLASKQAAADWSLTERLLQRTLRSVLHQDDPRWRAVICGHDKPDLAELDDPRVMFMEADIDPPADSRTFRKDKMWKRRLAAAVLRDLGGGYFCPLDADDLVHRGLVARVLEDDNRRGYGIDHGYVEDFANQRLAPVPGVWSAPFDRVCGSSAVLFFQAEELPRDGRQDPELYFNLFQQHAYWPIVAEELGRPLDNFPFPAGVYVVNHSQNLSFGLQRAGLRTANVIAAIERQAVADREGILRGEFGQGSGGG